MGFMWKAKTVLFWLLWGAHTLFCGVFLSAFLANVTISTGGKLFEAASVVLVEEHLLAPVLIAAFYAVCTTIVLCLRPGLMKELRGSKNRAIEEPDIEPDAEPNSPSERSSASWNQPDAKPEGDSELSDQSDAECHIIVPGCVEDDLNVSEFSDEEDDYWFRVGSKDRANLLLQMTFACKGRTSDWPSQSTASGPDDSLSL